MAHQAARPGSCYFYYPRLMCVIGVRDDVKATVNFAPVAWATPLSTDPPLYGVCLSPSTFTHQLLLKTGEFTISVLPFEMAGTVDALGRLSGREVDKVKALGIAVESPHALSTPTLAAAYASVECLLRERHQVGDQTLFVGEVQHVRLRPDAFDSDGVLRLDHLAPLLYLGNNRYVSADPSLAGPVDPAPTG